MTEATKAVSSARAVREQIAALGDKGDQVKGRLGRELAAFDERVGSVLTGEAGGKGEAGTPGLEALLGRASSLYGLIGAADVAPTAVQAEAAEQVDRELGAALDGWQALAAEVPELNRKLEKRGLPPLDLDAEPSSPVSGENLE